MPEKNPPAFRMSFVQKFDLMLLVRSSHTIGETDAEFAERAQNTLGFRVLPATVCAYREAFGIPATKPATAAEMRARIRELEVVNAKLTQQQTDSH